MVVRLAAALLVTLLLPALARAEPPSLSLPLDCALGETCWLMNAPDTDPGPAARDFRCRPRTYDGHDGTDIAVRDAGVAADVLAAAPGVVAGGRDGEPDGAFLAGGREAVRDRECGNGVLIRHGDGWETQYCHLRRGSVAVRPGQKVERGDRLGSVGLSGLSAFPHVHLSLRKDGTKLDPFTGARLDAGCGRDGAPLWRDLPYSTGALYAAGFADHIPTERDLKGDAGSPATLRRDGPALVVWMAALGVAAGDRVTLAVTGPDGAPVVSRTVTLERDQAWRSESVGRRTPPGGWPAGPYRAAITPEREGEPPRQRTATVELR